MYFQILNFSNFFFRIYKKLIYYEILFNKIIIKVQFIQYLYYYLYIIIEIE